LQQQGERSSLSASNEVNARTSAYRNVSNAVAEVVAVPILSLAPADSPRLNGEDKAHIARLAETETPLPPILVDRQTMRVIDGMHRLIAASLQGRETIDVVFFDGSEADVFLRAVEDNIAHGLPLSQTDRRAAAERIIGSHPHLSDRAIGQATGLAAKTVAAIRRRSTTDTPQLNSRVGRDGKVRPLDSGEGRRRAAELLASQPEASLRDVARAAGIAPATVLDVRKRLQRGEPPVPGKRGSGRTDEAPGQVTAGSAGHGSRAHANRVSASGPVSSPGAPPAARPATEPNPAAIVEKLLRDPSFRNTEQGKGMLRLLHINAVGTEQLQGVVPAVPPHCVSMVVRLANQYAKMWQDIAQELDGRARIIDPSATIR
jgi:ParB-like chromosome segregation protein Spo0J